MHNERNVSHGMHLVFAFVIALLSATTARAGDVVVPAYDSGEENEADGEMYKGSSDLELDRDGSWDQIIGIEYDDVPLVPGGTFGAVHLQMTAAESGSDVTELTIWAQKSGDPEGLEETYFNISSRTPTSASVSWTVDPWTAGERGAPQKSPDLHDIIQEVVNEPDWEHENKIILIIDGLGTEGRNAVSANGSAGQTPDLIIEDATVTVGINFFNDLNGDGIPQFGEAPLAGYAELELGDGSDLGLGYTDPTPGTVESPRGPDFGLSIGGWEPQYQDYLNLNPHVMVSTPLGYIGEFTPVGAIVSDTTLNVGFTIPTNYQDAPTKDPDKCYLVADRFFDGSTYGGDDTAVAIDLDNGQVLTQTQLGAIGATGVTDIEAAEFDPIAQKLYAANANELGEIDTTTGVYTKLADFGHMDVGGSPQEIDDVDGLAYDPVNKRWYGFDRRSSKPDLMFSFDPSLAPSDLIVVGHFGGADYVEIDPPTGDQTLVDIDDAAYDSRSGNMYAIANDGGSPTRIMEVDVATGDTVDLGLVYFDPDGAGSIGPTPVVDAEGLGASATGALYITTGSTSYLFEIEVGASSVDATLMARVLGGDMISDIESLACNTRSVVEVGGEVWEDVDGNGVRDAGDDGIAGVEMVLVAPDGSSAATTTTAADGTYSFSGLAAGFPYTTRVGASNFAVSGTLESYQITADSHPPLNGSATSILLDGAVNMSDTSASFGYTFVPPATCTDGILNQDETQIDCGGATCPACLTFGMHPDKSKMKFGKKASQLDYLLMQGGFELPGYDPTTCDFTLSITNANGAVTSFSLAAGDFQQSGKCAVYTDRAARRGGGTQRAQVCAMREPDRWRYKLKGFAEFSDQATLANMNVRLDTCGNAFARGTTWNPKRNGWLLPRSTWMP